MEPEAHHHAGNCKQVFALLSEYLDAELPEETCEEIAAHLEGCPPCIEFLESLRRTIALCREHRPVELPAPLTEQARAELLAAYRKSRDRRNVPQ
ncbi:MAG: zf-HC2 domain-containing protein [Acidobacteriota bacterium]